jgi:hypothetical protein
MRAAPAFQVSLQRFGVWRVGVGVLAALALAVMLGWLGSQQHPVGASVWALTVLGAAAALLPAWMALHQRPIDLRWDGQAWHLGDAASDAVPGELGVLLDLGAWMLLRFKPLPSGKIVWLPVQRRGLEAAWHALRCAVYASRSARPDDDAMVGH